MKHKFPTRWDRFKKWITYGDREITLRSPCCGYFERFESVDVFSFVVEP